MLGELITRCLILILGYVYPALECYKAVEKNRIDIEELRFWCQYWILVAFLTVLERIGDTFISWLPMYGELKLTLIIYLWYARTKGAGFVYETFLRPYMANTDIEKKMLELRARVWDFALYYWQNYTEVGSTKFFELLQYLANQSKADQQHSKGLPMPSGTGIQSEKNKKWPPSAPPLPSGAAQFKAEFENIEETIPRGSPNPRQSWFRPRRTKPNN